MEMPFAIESLHVPEHLEERKSVAFLSNSHFVMLKSTQAEAIFNRHPLSL